MNATVMTARFDGSGDRIPLVPEHKVDAGAEWTFLTNFTLAANQYAVVSFQLSDLVPQGGFFLTQIDPDSQAAVYFSGSLAIRETGPNVIPEPITMVGCLIGLGAVTRYARKRRA